MESKVSSKSVMLTYGLIYGFIIILTSVMIYAANMQYEESAGYAALGVVLLSIIFVPVLAMLKFKKENLNIISWGQAVKLGMGVVLIGTLLNLGYSFLFAEIIEPQYNETTLQIQRQALIDDGRMTTEQIDQQMEISAMFQGTLIGAAIGLLFFAFVSFVVSAIAGAIVKRTEEDNY